MTEAQPPTPAAAAPLSFPSVTAAAEAILALSYHQSGQQGYSYFAHTPSQLVALCNHLLCLCLGVPHGAPLFEGLHTNVVGKQVLSQESISFW